MKRRGQQLKNEDGVTLVELLAAVAILSIIVTSFLAYFIQAGRANNMTTEVNEATFLAQEEMERVTYFAQNGYTYKQVTDDYYKNGYENITVDGKYDLGIINRSDDYSTKIEFILPKTTASDETSQSLLHHVVVTISEGGSSRAQMETVVPLQPPAK